MCRKFFPILFLIFQIFGIGQVHGDFYTSIAHLDELLDSEIYLLETYENFLKQVKLTNQRIIGFLDEVESNIQEIRANPVLYFENPLNAFQVIKRCVFDWRNLEELVLSDNDAKDFGKNISKMDDLGYAKATRDDLMGASKGLARLQSTYHLETANIAKGVLLDYEYNSTLSAHDCFELSCTLNDAKEIQYAGQWLWESRLLLETDFRNSGITKMSDNFPFLSDVNILEHLATNMYDSGNKNNARDIKARKLNS